MQKKIMPGIRINSVISTQTVIQYYKIRGRNYNRRPLMKIMNFDFF